MGPYTGVDVVLKTRFHRLIVERKLTPHQLLSILAPLLQRDVVQSFNEVFPTGDDWSEMQIYPVLAKMTETLSALAIVGPEFRNNPKWLDVALNYPENGIVLSLPNGGFLFTFTALRFSVAYKTLVMLRLFPMWIRPYICYFLPSYRECQRLIKASETVLAPKIKELLQKKDNGSWAPQGTEEDSNVLSWTIHLAKGEDRDPATIAHSQLILGLASVHTTTQRTVHILYDIMANPELIDILRAEIESVASEPGGWNPSSYDKLPKLDSVMRESQRLTPTLTVTMGRVFDGPYTFEDGTHIPVNSYACVPGYAMENDPDRVSDPYKFDGLRTYREYVKSQGQADEFDDRPFKFSTPGKSYLGFGYGKTACPGRHFASMMIKIELVKLLTEYDVKFLPGTERPKTSSVLEFTAHSPTQKILVKKRKAGTSPF